MIIVNGIKITNQAYRANTLKYGGNYYSTLERAQYSCSVCGGNRHLVVHHRDGNRSNNGVENLVALCGVCHARVHKAYNYNKDRNDTIYNLWDGGGYTLQRIGDIYGISKQRVYQIIDRIYPEKHNTP